MAGMCVDGVLDGEQGDLGCLHVTRVASLPPMCADLVHFYIAGRALFTKWLAQREEASAPVSITLSDGWYNTPTMLWEGQAI